MTLGCGDRAVEKVMSRIKIIRYKVDTGKRVVKGVDKRQIKGYYRNVNDTIRQ